MKLRVEQVNILLEKDGFVGKKMQLNNPLKMMSMGLL
jgi:hypothetical protein